MSDEAPNKTERKLRRTGSKQNLRGVVGDTEADDIEVFGYELVYTTGEFTIDRDTFIEKATDFGIPEWMLPGETMHHNAFGYAMDDLLDAPDMGGDLHEIEFDGQRVQFNLRQNESRYSYTLDASVYYPPEMTSSDTGEWVAVENDDGKQGLGVIEYDSDNREELRFIDRIDDDMALAPIWNGSDTRTGFKDRAQVLYEKHIASHRGKDVNNMTYYLVDNWTDSIKLRDACYFVPASHVFGRYDGETQRFPFDADNEEWRKELSQLLQSADPTGDDPEHVGYTGAFQVEEEEVEDGKREVVVEVEREYPIDVLVDAFQLLYEWLNLHAEKPSGAQDTHLDIIEIVDTDRQRKMVERKAQKKMEQQAERMAGTVLDRLKEDETMVEDIVDEVSSTMDELSATAGEYDDLLADEANNRSVQMKRENAIRRALDSVFDDMSDDEAELVEEVLSEVDGAPADAVDEAAAKAAT